jgi:hypothetical protein|tara:strand:+ start:144 stop:410 length:267 start_codon:yes stop_codon:yes gene_type:complete
LTDRKDLKDNIKIELFDQDPHDVEFLGETYVRIEALEPMRRIDLAVELEKASTGSMRLSVVFTPVSELIERRATIISAEKHLLANKKG